jgi:hypothetical protein
MGRMSDLHIEMQESGMLDDPDNYPRCLTTEILANEILFHFQGKTFRPEDQIEAWTEANQNASELRNLIQELLDRHMTVFYQP